MEIFLPTRGRVDNQVTLQLLPDEIRKQVTIVCHPGEEDALDRLWGGKVWDIVPVAARNIGEVRQYCIDNIARSAYPIFVDDSLNFHIRERSDTGIETKFLLKEITERYFTPAHIMEYRARVFRWLNNVLRNDEYGMVGISRRSGNNNTPTAYKINERVCSFWGINLKKFRRLRGNPEFSDFPIKEDFYIYLHFLTNGFPTITAFKYAYGRVGGANSAGGCSDYRNCEVSNQAARRLYEAFPEFVRIVTKRPKSWNGEMADAAVEDVYIQSKKAYLYGLQRTGR